MESWTIKEWGILISLIFSLASICIIIYKDFINGSKLETVLNTIVLIRLAEENKAGIILQILLDDLLSGRPSDQAIAIINAKPEIANAVRQRNRELTSNNLINYSIELSSNGTGTIIYDASQESIQRYIGDKSFSQSFYVPLNIVNTGRKTGDITTLILKITSNSDKNLKWMYSCFTEIKADEFLSFNNSKPLGSIVGKLFPGISIGQGNNHRLDAFMIPIDSANRKIISTKSLHTGSYSVQIVGYNSRNKKCLESNISNLNLEIKTFVDIFNGSNIVQNLTMESHIEKEI